MISQRNAYCSNAKVSAGVADLTQCAIPNMIKVVLHYA
jgi:hypothetical protein